MFYSVDDVINVSGHRMGTAEVESALLEHSDVAEAAVVGYPHEMKGEGAFGVCGWWYVGGWDVDGKRGREGPSLF